MKLRAVGLWVTAVLVLAVVLGLVVSRERLLAQGQVVFLELAPVDPRSLIQGDYMLLRYDVAEEAEQAVRTHDGHLVVRVDDRGVAEYVRVHDPGTLLTADERLLRYRERQGHVRIGPESFFFQEGHAAYYGQARYAEVRLSPSGDVLLTGLRGPALQPLGPPGELP